MKKVTVVVFVALLLTTVLQAQTDTTAKASSACGMLAPPRIYFAPGEVHLSRSDSLALDTLLCFMREYPTLTVGIYCYAEADEIRGGDSATRTALAILRAEIAKSYLVSSGFAASRLSIRNMTSRPPLPPKGIPPLSGRRLEFYLMNARQK
ncbi:MAG: hypothetical protein JNL32_06740 [Candidatus Kapabacteria bacterium]|nr:hypothetical protein [Candidatus Kapabacteria bacterium]